MPPGVRRGVEATSQGRRAQPRVVFGPAVVCLRPQRARPLCRIKGGICARPQAGSGFGSDPMVVYLAIVLRAPLRSGDRGAESDPGPRSDVLAYVLVDGGGLRTPG